MKGGNMKPNRIVMKVYGKYALFTDPMTKIGGEKSSMMIPSYETLKGIVCGNYWKPSIDWIIESVKVLNPIRTERKESDRLSIMEEMIFLIIHICLMLPILFLHILSLIREDLIYRKIGMKTSIITWQSVLLKKEEEEIYF